MFEISRYLLQELSDLNITESSHSMSPFSMACLQRMQVSS